MHWVMNLCVCSWLQWWWSDGRQREGKGKEMSFHVKPIRLEEESTRNMETPESACRLVQEGTCHGNTNLNSAEVIDHPLHTGVVRKQQSSFSRIYRFEA